MLVLLLSGGRVWGNGWVDSYRQEYKVLRLGVNSTTGPVNKCAHYLAVAKQGDTRGSELGREASQSL